MFQDSWKFTRKNYHHKNHAESIYWNGVADSSINIYPGSMDQSSNYEHFLSKNLIHHNCSNKSKDRSLNTATNISN